jgi:hypothetical protein
MFTRFQKIFQHNLAKYASGSIVFLLLFLSTGYDFFHNHDADFEKHGECPVYHFLIVLSSVGIPGALVFKIFIYRETSLFTYIDPFKYGYDKIINGIRGPPASFLSHFYKEEINKN